jgi:pyrimidine-nucleoside phosphorylase
MAGVYLGAGRSKTSDPVFPDVGIIFHKKKGDAVSSGEPVCDIFAQTEAAASSALLQLESALSIADKPPQAEPMIIKEYSAL